jgi:two-component system sporulation sensor kinase A
MLNELDRINLILNEFLLLSKPHSANFSKADIRVVLEHVLTLIETQAIMNKVRIVNTADDDIPLLLCDENQMKQVFVNVLKNAIEAMPDGGKVTVSTKRAGDYVRIRIEDEGEGIPGHLLESIGEPFFTTKENGTGLGLMICHKIMENHGGKLTISSRQGEGTVVDIDLPCESKNAGLYAT